MKAETEEGLFEEYDFWPLWIILIVIRASYRDCAYNHFVNSNSLVVYLQDYVFYADGSLVCQLITAKA